MNAIKTGGPAFPCEAEVEAPYDGHNSGKSIERLRGMTLRDYLAASHKPMEEDMSTDCGKVLLGRECPKWGDDPVGNAIWWADYRSALRYMEADAMLRAREAETKPSRYAGGSHD